MNAIRTTTIPMALVILGILSAACGGGASFTVRPSSDEAEVRSLMERQFDLMRDENWRELYETLSPQLQEHCPYDEFLDAYSGALMLSGVDLNALGVEERNVRVEGDVGYTTYIVTYNGRDVDVVTEADPDIYVRVNGRWYDEVDSHTECK